MPAPLRIEGMAPAKIALKGRAMKAQGAALGSVV
jgi:hypothetical protein